jgi:hypothetical protein
VTSGVKNRLLAAEILPTRRKGRVREIPKMRQTYPGNSALSSYRSAVYKREQFVAA